MYHQPLSPFGSHGCSQVWLDGVVSTTSLDSHQKENAPGDCVGVRKEHRPRGKPAINIFK